MRQTLVIAPRFHGPPSSANGGYTAGLLANAAGNSAECTLRAPPPLDAPLELSICVCRPEVEP